MGKGDLKTKRGKIVNKSFGKHRLHKKKNQSESKKSSSGSEQTETKKSA